MELKNKTWKDFLIGDIFEISTGALLSKQKLKRGIIPRITATDLNNGIYAHYAELAHNNYRTSTNFISISFLGSVFFHPYKASLDMKIHSVKLKEREFNKYLGQFITLCLKRTTSLFSYGDQLSSKDLPNKKILLPINKEGLPDFDYMIAFMQQKEKEKFAQYIKHINKRIEQTKKFKQTIPLDHMEMGEFEIGDLFELIPGKSKGLNHLMKSNSGVNYLGATNSNNGVLASVYIDENSKMIQEGNCIAFIRNGEGSMGFSIYKAESFIATSDISVGYSKHLNREVGLFITTIADKVRGKYNFGYKRSTTRLKKEKLQLPINENGEPDFDYMGNFIKKLEHEKLTKYIKEKISNL